MAQYPLLFGYRNLVAGNAFLAGVTMDGRALLVDEEGGAWVYGVNPGSLAAGGHDHTEATVRFKEAYCLVLDDIATSAANFDDFKAEVERFFEEVCGRTEEAWDQAVEKVKSQEVNLDWLAKRPAESRRGVEVVLVREITHSENRLDDELMPALAA